MLHSISLHINAAVEFTILNQSDYIGTFSHFTPDDGGWDKKPVHIPAITGNETFKVR